MYLSTLQARSTASFSAGSLSDVSLLPEPSRPSLCPSFCPASAYQSLPALDRDCDQLDRELAELAHGVDTLYLQVTESLALFEIDWGGTNNHGRIHIVKSFQRAGAVGD